MGYYITLIRYTQQGAAKIKESPTRLDAAKKAAGAVGGKIHAWYLTMGKYDAVIVSEFPNDEASGEIHAVHGLIGQHHHANHESLYRSRIPQNRRFSVSVSQEQSGDPGGIAAF